MLVILLNCITLGMYQPCVDEECQGNRCKILQVSIAQIASRPFFNWILAPVSIIKNAKKFQCLKFFKYFYCLVLSFFVPQCDFKN